MTKMQLAISELNLQMCQILQASSKKLQELISQHLQPIHAENQM